MILGGSTCGQAIQQDPVIARGGSKLRVSDRVGDIVIPQKDNNQRLIALTHNLVFHFRTKQIDIQHHYIWDEVASQRI